MTNIDPEVLARRKKIQVEIIIKESDARRLERNKIALEAEIHAMKSKKQQIELDVAIKESKLKHMQDELMMMQNELIKLKHQMSSSV
ncbi:MAG: hypothetical protein WCF93_00200 [Candidatus Moraniibacteriota bacterium]|jgi:hypothetical protein